MTTGNKETIGQKAEAFFENLWREGNPWEFETSDYDQASYRQQTALLSDRRYARAIEIGCGAGSFTRHLAGLADHVLAVDVAPTAIRNAQRAGIGTGAVEFRVANVMDEGAQIDGPWDLVVLNETIYYIGWLYTFFDVYWLAHRLVAATRAGGRLLMTNTSGRSTDYLQHPELVRTYRDLFVNVGCRIEREQVLHGRKSEVEFDALITLFSAPAEEGTVPPRR